MSTLIATKCREGEVWLPRFITQVEALEGDIDRIVVMYGASRDATYALLEHWRDTSRHRVEIYKDPYLPPEERNGATLARVKQDIQKILRASTAKYYLNLDCDLVRLPVDLIPRLMEADKDIVAAMVWTEGREVPTFFDTYVFRSDGARFHPFNPPGAGRTEPFTVDSVSTCYLAKREVELAGVYSNPYPHIFFCEDLRKQGFQVWVHPLVHAVHIDLEKLGIMHQPLPHILSIAPYVDDRGFKWRIDQVGAQIYHQSLALYKMGLLEREPDAIVPSIAWLKTRGLITASYKVWNEAEYLPYSLASVYPYVDRIDIIEGGVALRGGKPSTDGTVGVIRDFPDPEHKIRLIEGSWESKEEIQRKLLEVCKTKWMLFIDGDEVIGEEGMGKLRVFCEAHPDGDVAYARPERFLNFWHDWMHVAYSLNPMSPWAQTGTPHAFLIHRDVPGLNFGAFHTIPLDGFGSPLSMDDPQSRLKKAVIDGLTVLHFGNAKPREAVESKLTFEHDRGINYPREVSADPWLTGEMEPDFVIDEYREVFPDILKAHPMYGKVRIRVTQKNPNYRFEVLP